MLQFIHSHSSTPFDAKDSTGLFLLDLSRAFKPDALLAGDIQAQMTPAPLTLVCSAHHIQVNPAVIPVTLNSNVHPHPLGAIFVGVDLGLGSLAYPASSSSRPQGTDALPRPEKVLTLLVGSDPVDCVVVLRDVTGWGEDVSVEEGKDDDCDYCAASNENKVEGLMSGPRHLFSR